MSTLDLNNSNNTGVAEDPPFGYLTLFLTLFFLTPATVINVLLLASIITEKTIPKTIRLVLTNIVIACEVVIVGLMAIFLSAVILSGLQHLSPSGFSCRFILSIISGGSAARLLSMATFATILYILVHHGAAKIKFIPTVIAVVLLWVFSIGPNFVLLSPAVEGIAFPDGDDCAAYGVGAGTYVYTFSFILVYGLGSFILSILFPLLSLRYVMKNTISGDTKLQKAMIKFSIFLLIGNTMSFIGICVPLLFITFVPLPPTSPEFEQLAKNFNLVEGAFLLLSLIPPPIIILVFFKPIRHRLKGIICFHCLRSDAQKPKYNVNASDHTPGTTSDVL